MGAINWNNVVYNENEQKLIFSNQDFSSIPEAIINLYHSRVRHLDLSFNELTSLNGLGLFINLDELILDNNNFNDLIKFPNNLRNLKVLSLNNNKIQNLDLLLLKLSSAFPNLEYLSLLFNPVCKNQLIHSNNNEADYKIYRLNVIKCLRNLKILDSNKVSMLERHKYKTDKKVLVKLTKPKLNKNWTPLPHNNREVGDHKGAYGKCKYKYIGTQSEGNRFISNNDL